MFIPPATKSLHGSSAVKVRCTDTINNGHVLQVPVKHQSQAAICRQFADYAKPDSALTIKPNKANVEHFHISLGTFLQISSPDASLEPSTSEN